MFPLVRYLRSWSGLLSVKPFFRIVIRGHYASPSTIFVFGEHPVSMTHSWRGFPRDMVRTRHLRYTPSFHGLLLEEFLARRFPEATAFEYIGNTRFSSIVPLEDLRVLSHLCDDAFLGMLFRKHILKAPGILLYFHCLLPGETATFLLTQLSRDSPRNTTSMAPQSHSLSFHLASSWGNSQLFRSLSERGLPASFSIAAPEVEDLRSLDGIFANVGIHNVPLIAWRNYFGAPSRCHGVDHDYQSGIFRP